MAEISIHPYRRINTKNSKRHRLGTLILQLDKSDLMRAVFAFLLARCQIFTLMTPFLLSYYAATYKKEKSMIPMAFGALGLISMGGGIGSLKYVMAMLIFSLYRYVWGDRVNRIPLDLTLCFLSLFAGGYLFIVLDGFVIYDTLFLAVECGLCVLGYLFCKEATPFIMSLFFERGKKRWVLNTEFICCCFFLSFVAAGLYGLLTIYQFHIISVLVVFFVILVSYNQGIHLGVLAGAICGAMLGLVEGNMVATSGLYVLCALSAGILSQFGKIAVVIGVMLCALLSAMLSGESSFAFMNIYEIMASCLAFSMIPRRRKESRFAFENGVNPIQNEQEFASMQTFLTEKLQKTTESFQKLSSTFSDISERRIKTCRGELGDIVNETGKRICKDCSMFSFCWKQDFAPTYGALYALVEKTQEKGYADMLDADEKFAKHCTRLKEMTVCINHLYELYKVNVRWTSQLMQNRQLISEQYYGISKIVAHLCDDVSKDTNFRNSQKNKIMAELFKAHYKVVDVRVVEIGDARTEVTISLKENRSAFEFISDIALRVSCVLNKPMVIVEEKKEGALRHITMTEADRYGVKTGMAMTVQTDSKECGDSVDFYRLPDNRFVMALSDGMGSGQAAARESRATLDLLKEFLSAGFDKQTALELINSALLLKSAEESFATIDLSMISLTTGSCEFVKIGSATSFIKHLTYAEAIYSTSLPAGILTSIDAELATRNLEDGDLVILMSDGVLESDHRRAISEEWVFNFLNENDDILDPQIMADKILAEALKNCGGKPRDDMTVLVSRIVKKQN